MHTKNSTRGPLRAGILLAQLTLPVSAARAQVPAAPATFPLTVVATDSANFTVAPGRQDLIQFAISNPSAQGWSGELRTEITDAAEVPDDIKNSPVTIVPNGQLNLPFTFDAQGLESGEYDVRLLFQKDGKTQYLFDQPLVVAGPLDLYILFDPIPREQGMTFETKSFRPHAFMLDGINHPIWTGGSSLGGPGWWHSMVFKLTDPRFQNGNMPAADVTVRFFDYDSLPNTLTADMASGSEKVATIFGGGAKWRVLKCQLNGAEFAGTDHHSLPADLGTDGYDLRFNSCNDAIQIRSIFVHGYDRTANPDFGRLLHCDQIDAGRDLNIFNPGEKANIIFKLSNYALIPLHSPYTLQLKDDLANPLWTRQGILDVPANGSLAFPAAVDTGPLQQGVYTLALQIDQSTAKNSAPNDSAVNFAVSDTIPIPKAKPGDFLYGCDTGVDTSDERYMKWLDYMGVDLVRGNGVNDPAKDWTAAFSAFDQHHLLNTSFYDIRWQNDPAKYQKWIDENTVMARAVAQKYGDRAHYWELGNEPDLTFFFPGPMSEYVRGMTAIANAIRRGNPNAVIMNGGLSFAGPAGDERSREFLKIIPRDALNIVAYHGHGPLVTAERTAYLRAHDEAEKWGKGDLPFFETESGCAAATPAQIRIQTRTSVEKMVFAQSVHEPSLLWFRLFITGGDGGYTNLINIHEPRPCVLSYRTMSKLLHGEHFQRTLDAGAGSSVEAYLFAQTTGPKRAVVVWSDEGNGSSTLKLAQRGSGVSEVKMVDLFGNASPLSVSPDGTVTMAESLDPAYITWNGGSSPLSGVQIQPSPLQVPQMAILAPSGPDFLHLSVENFSDHPLLATLSVKSNAPDELRVPQEETRITVPPGGDLPVPVAVQSVPDTDAVNWPKHWTVFGNVPAEGIDPASFHSIPAAIAVAGKSIPALLADPHDGELDLSALTGGIANRREALCFASIDAARTGPVAIGAGADYWMAWYVNGVKVWDDLESGNGGPVTLSSHQFSLPLKKGANLLVVEVESGSQGYKLVSGGPRELALASGGGRSLDVELSSGQDVLARGHVPVDDRQVIQATPDLTSLSPDALQNLEPAGRLDETTVINDWAKQPDSSKWWKGAGDLSGTIWLGRDTGHLYLAAAIRDDVFQPSSAANIDAGDSLRLAVAGGPNDPLQLGIPGDGSGLYRRSPAGGWRILEGGIAKVDRVDTPDGGVTWYRIAIPRADLPAVSGNLAFNVLVNDNDWGVHKQSEAWFPGIDEANPFADSWYAAVLP